MSELEIDFQELYAFYISEIFSTQIMNYKVELIKKRWKMDIDQFNTMYRDWYVIAKEQGDI